MYYDLSKRHDALNAMDGRIKIMTRFLSNNPVSVEKDDAWQI